MWITVNCHPPRPGKKSGWEISSRCHLVRLRESFWQSEPSSPSSQSRVLRHPWKHLKLDQRLPERPNPASATWRAEKRRIQSDFRCTSGECARASVVPDIHQRHAIMCHQLIHSTFCRWQPAVQTHLHSWWLCLAPTRPRCTSWLGKKMAHEVQRYQVSGSADNQQAETNLGVLYHSWTRVGASRVSQISWASLGLQVELQCTCGCCNKEGQYYQSFSVP